MQRLYVIGLVAVLMIAGPVGATVVSDLVPTSDTLTLRQDTLYVDGAEPGVTVYEGVKGVHASFSANVTEDPLVWVRKNVENDTGYGWAGYQIDYAMLSTFSIVAVVPQPGWIYSATPVVPMGNGKYGATVFFSVDQGGSVIANGDYGEFDVRLSIPTGVKFCVDQTPFAPEPVSLALLALGGLLFRRTRK